MAYPWLRQKRVRRDYSRKSFSNPLFSPVREGGIRWRRWLTALAAAVAVIGWVWFAAFSPAFRVTDIRIHGTQNLSEWEVRDAVRETLARRRWLLLPQSSLLVLSEADVIAGLNERYVLESLEVTKKPPHTLEIDLKERVSSILLQMPDGSQVMTGLDGTVTRIYAPSEALDAVPKLGPDKGEAASRAKPPAYAVLYDDRAETFALRASAIRPEVIAMATALPKAFESVLGPAMALTQIHLDGAASQSLRIVTSEGWAVYLNASGDLRNQLNDAQAVLKAKIGDNRKNLEYIDVRFGEKVFFKLRS